MGVAKYMYLVFCCRKCGHQLYVSTNKYKNLVNTLIYLAEKSDCPACGEEPYENWVLVGGAESFPEDEED